MYLFVVRSKWYAEKDGRVSDGRLKREMEVNEEANRNIR